MPLNFLLKLNFLNDSQKWFSQDYVQNVYKHTKIHDKTDLI